MLPKLMPLEEWRTQRFTTPPSPATVRRWISNGDIPGKHIGGKWFVDICEEAQVNCAKEEDDEYDTAC